MILQDCSPARAVACLFPPLAFDFRVRAYQRTRDNETLRRRSLGIIPLSSIFIAAKLRDAELLWSSNLSTRISTASAFFRISDLLS
jgi:hypothetical protein